VVIAEESIYYYVLSIIIFYWGLGEKRVRVGLVLVFGKVKVVWGIVFLEEVWIWEKPNLTLTLPWG
jgi:hypothetical protein